MDLATTIKQLLANFRPAEAAALLRHHRPHLLRQIARAERLNGGTGLRGMLQQMLTDPATWREQGAQKITVERVQAAIKVATTHEDEPTAGDYPAHYPPVLVENLLVARRLVAQKRRLSNQLRHRAPKPAADLTGQITTLQQQIDFIYKAKRAYDSSRMLPDEWTGKNEGKQQEIRKLRHELALIRSRISRYKARLKNPDELKNGEPAKWREALRTDEKRRAAIKQQLLQLRYA